MKKHARIGMTNNVMKICFGMCKWDVYKDDGDLYSCILLNIFTWQNVMDKNSSSNE